MCDVARAAPLVVSLGTGMLSSRRGWARRRWSAPTPSWAGWLIQTSSARQGTVLINIKLFSYSSQQFRFSKSFKESCRNFFGCLINFEFHYVSRDCNGLNVDWTGIDFYNDSFIFEIQKTLKSSNVFLVILILHRK